MAGFASLAEIEAFEATPLVERGLPDNTYAAVQRTAAAHPDLPALIFFLQGAAYQHAVTFTFREFLGKLTQTANMFHALGVGPQDTVSYVLPNLPQTYFTLYGGEAAGVANPINPLLEPRTIAEIMNAARTKVLVTLAPFPKVDVWEKVSSIVDDVPTLETILQVDIAGYLSGIKKLVVNVMRLGKRGGSVRARVLDFDKMLAQQPADRLVSGRTIAAGDIASYFHTGGTTGVPKLAMHSHANEVFDGWMSGLVVGLAPGLRNYLGLPLFHNYGAIAVGLGSWIHGTGVVMGTPQGFRGEGVVANFWKILDHHKINGLAGVPTLYKALLNVPVGDADLSALRVAICGSAPLPVELARQFTARTNVNILEGYGLTEGTSVSSANPFAGTPRIGSVGLRFAYQEMRIAQIDGDQFVRFCEPGETGIVVVRGPNVFPGYKEAVHNQGVFVDTGDGRGRWLNTGDMGYQDVDGFFWLTGRKKELIIRGGHNIDPKQIEEPMYQHPAVALAAAVGRPDPRVGELPVVYVELKPDMTASEDELMAFAQTAIGERAAVPKQVRITDQLPLTAVGKVYKLPLIYEQVVDVFTAELRSIEGVATVDVRAEGHKQWGTLALVTVAAQPGVDKAHLEAAIRERLGSYPVRYELTVV